MGISSFMKVTVGPTSRPRAAFLAMDYLQGYQPGQQGSRIELAEQRLEDHEHPRNRMDGGNVAITEGGQGDEAEIRKLLLPGFRVEVVSCAGRLKAPARVRSHSW